MSSLLIYLFSFLWYVRAQYANKYAPVFTRRAAIIAGQQKPTDADIAKGVEVSEEVRGHVFSYFAAS